MSCRRMLTVLECLPHTTSAVLSPTMCKVICMLTGISTMRAMHLRLYCMRLVQGKVLCSVAESDGVKSYWIQLTPPVRVYVLRYCRSTMLQHLMEIALHAARERRGGQWDCDFNEGISGIREAGEPASFRMRAQFHKAFRSICWAISAPCSPFLHHCAL